MGFSKMTDEERKTRFEVALEIAEKAYSDYCKDENKSREQCLRFNDCIQEMIKMLDILRQEASNISH